MKKTQISPEQVIELQAYSGEADLMYFLQHVDQLRNTHSVYWSDVQQGFWMVTEYEHIREIMQDPARFSSSAIQVVDPDPDYVWVPSMLDPPVHTTWRHLLAPHFTRARLDGLDDRIRERARDLVTQIESRGACDFREDFADEFPTSIFMELMGLPAEDTSRFMGWTKAILNTPAEDDPDRTIANQAMDEANKYFTNLIAERRQAPKDDLVSAAIGWEIDGRKVSDEELLSMSLLMMMAGLDTVTCQLVWCFHHLAVTPSDRARVVSDPAVIPDAVEELLRYYTIIRIGRKVVEDTDFHGCPMKGGDMVYLPLNGACRDPKAFERADEVILNRSPNKHIAFGAGPHRCIGADLARRELRIALEEWHALIPDYKIGPGAVIREYGGAELGIPSLPLVWNR